MNGEKPYRLGQLLALCSVAALTPALRLLPGASAAARAAAGSPSKLCPSKLLTGDFKNT